MDRQDLLIKKIEKEFNSFKWELMKLDKAQIIDRAYEIATKEDIKGYIESEELSDYQVERLLSANNTLQALYTAWQEMDTSHTEDIRVLLWHLCDYSRELPKETQNELPQKDNVYTLDFGNKQDDNEQSTDNNKNSNEEDEFEH